MKLLGIVEVLGANYDILESNENEDADLAGIEGYCDHTVHRIVINTFEPDDGSYADLEAFRQRIVRHELIHAFLAESGLAEDSWASNEEIIDWIARQFPKMLEAFKSAGALEGER